MWDLDLKGNLKQIKPVHVCTRVSVCVYACMCVYTWERRGDASVYALGLLHSSSSMMDALGVVCKYGTTEGGRLSLGSWLKQYSGKSLLLSWFLQSLPGPHPTQFIPLSCDQTSCCNSLRMGVDVIQSDSGSGSGWYSSSTSSLWRKEKEKTKHKK